MPAKSLLPNTVEEIKKDIIGRILRSSPLTDPRYKDTSRRFLWQNHDFEGGVDGLPVTPKGDVMAGRKYYLSPTPYGMVGVDEEKLQDFQRVVKEIRREHGVDLILGCAPLKPSKYRLAFMLGDQGIGLGKNIFGEECRKPGGGMAALKFANDIRQPVFFDKLNKIKRCLQHDLTATDSQQIVFAFPMEEWIPKRTQELMGQVVWLLAKQAGLTKHDYVVTTKKDQKENKYWFTVKFKSVEDYQVFKKKFDELCQEMAEMHGTEAQQTEVRSR